MGDIFGIGDAIGGKEEEKLLEVPAQIGMKQKSMSEVIREMKEDKEAEVGSKEEEEGEELVIGEELGILEHIN